MPEPRQFNPLGDDHPAIGMTCPACGVPFTANDVTTLVALGPGDDPEEQAKARAGRAYNAVAALVHWRCATGAEPKGAMT